ncbi:2-dehydro-3-deoxyphosphooctonate aldolase [Hyunsoonleella sp. SJ7]|uniref:2-dehydro-3-deoxyphosphooctonate aldolase n=1 Tax=Hyunsoonleella aquatilis TaxID=2762758 RepID=A0A923HC87_9FLAO|nr:2-dehydro-3-deoxyphosphooctonate aldolase [Hyunsoonleella aquatilis]MBC3759919.1 2-dehydro-3-deoxyphosphooctonate aldolase [Hyunsoonleella aquatilis]
MKKILIAFVALVLFLSCGSTQQASKNTAQILRDNNTFVVTEIAKDKTYGYSPKNPVEVGGAKDSEGPKNERRFLNALAGPNGEQISYYRDGSCCPVKSNNDPFGFGSVMLDNYRVTWENSKDTVSIYINMYDSGPLKAPIGFTIRK